MIRSETYLQAKKQCALVDQLLDQSFPGSRIARFKKKIEACSQDQEASKVFNNACKKLQYITNDLGNSILHEAVLKGYKGLCRLFAAEGLQNSKNFEEETPLHLAIRINSTYAFSILVQSNSTLRAQNKFGETAVEIALSLDRFHFVKRLFKQVEGLDELMPKGRQLLFLKALWDKNDTKLLELVAKRFFTQPAIAPLYTLEYARDTRVEEREWILNPHAQADLLDFSITKDDWDVVLLHMLGSKAWRFLKIAPHLENGSLVESMYAVLLKSWRAFWQSKPFSPNHLFVEIDKAIGGALYGVSCTSLRNKIFEGRNPVIIASGWSEHSLTVVFMGSYLFLCNGGEHAEGQEYDITCYRIKRQSITAGLIRKVKRCENYKKEKSEKIIFKELPQALGGYFDAFSDSVHSSLQPASLNESICVAKNLRLAIRSILLAKNDSTVAFQLYHEYIQFARYSTLEQFLRQKK